MQSPPVMFVLSPALFFVNHRRMSDPHLIASREAHTHIPRWSWPYLGIADGMSVARVWACRYSK